ncbi:MAG: hypothetical protein ACRC8K_16435, partial [Waterburya sp.]
MDVELQIIKHLKRDAQPTVALIDEYCSSYKNLFSEVRSDECFKYLHLGIISPIKRKSLPEIAKVVGINSAHQKVRANKWKTTLNNLRLIIQLTILLWLIVPWLEVFPNHHLL